MAAILLFSVPISGIIRNLIKILTTRKQLANHLKETLLELLSTLLRLHKITSFKNAVFCSISGTFQGKKPPYFNISCHLNVQAERSRLIYCVQKERDKQIRKNEKEITKNEEVLRRFLC